MANLVEVSNFDSDVYLVETTDLVLGGGGPGDIANKQAQALANRTTFLKDNLYRLKNTDVINATTALLNTDANILYTLTAAGNINVILPDVTTVAAGSLFPFASIMPFGKCGSIITTGPDRVKYADGDNRAAIYLYNGERITFVAAGDHWQIQSAFGNFESVGESFGARKKKGNTIINDGQLISRADYARLWEFVQTLTLGQELVDDATWLAGIGPEPLAYRGCFSQGDGVTTFRLPDERGMFDRYLDLARGVDIARVHDFAGGYEKDQNKAHDHFMFNGSDTGGGPYISSGHSTGGNLGYSMNGSNGVPNVGKTSESGGTEVITKNIGKIPLTRF